MQKKCLVVLCLLIQLVGYSQSKWSPYTKGRMYFFWGWNRAVYTNSDLSIKGADYDLKISHIKAHDRPTTPVSYHNYLQPNRLTIPQNNWRVGYFIRKDLAISFGTDHMKYVMDQYQTANVHGSISREGTYKGDYDGQVMLTPEFLSFEHTDGLNYVNFEIEKYRTFLQSGNNNWVLSGILAAGVGMLLPKTNVKFLDYERNDRFHISGFGLNIKAGLEAVIWKNLALRLEGKGGYIDMPAVILHKKGIAGKGKQDFMFAALDGVIAWNFRTHHLPKAATSERNIN